MYVDKLTMKALEESIQVWESHLNNLDNMKIGPVYCPLCLIYNNPFYDTSAGCTLKTSKVSCPIARVAGTSGCRNTPYSSVINAKAWYRAFSVKNTKRELITAMQEEIHFLKSVRAQCEMIEE